MPRYEHVSGAMFTLIAAAQLGRTLLRLPVEVGTFSIPVWWSLIPFVVTASLAAWAFRSAASVSRREP